MRVFLKMITRDASLIKVLESLNPLGSQFLNFLHLELLEHTLGHRGKYTLHPTPDFCSSTKSGISVSQISCFPMTKNNLYIGITINDRNNYFWFDPDSTPGFIANGDLIQIQHIHDYKDLYEFQFARVTVQLVDYPDEAAFETALLLDTLSSESPALTSEENQSLYYSVLEDYAHLPSKYKQLLEVKSNPYYNAL